MSIPQKLKKQMWDLVEEQRPRKSIFKILKKAYYFGDVGKKKKLIRTNDPVYTIQYEDKDYSRLFNEKGCILRLNTPKICTKTNVKKNEPGSLTTMRLRKEVWNYTGNKKSIFFHTHPFLRSAWPSKADFEEYLIMALGSSHPQKVIPCQGVSREDKQHLFCYQLKPEHFAKIKNSKDIKTMVRKYYKEYDKHFQIFEKTVTKYWDYDLDYMYFYNVINKKGKVTSLYAPSDFINSIEESKFQQVFKKLLNFSTFKRNILDKESIPEYQRPTKENSTFIEEKSRAFAKKNK